MRLTSSVPQHHSSAHAAPVHHNAAKSKGPTDFKVGSFNVLGASHTAPGGNKASRPSGVERMKLAAQVIQQHKLDVVGFQEFEPSQRKAFMHDTKNQFAMYPGTHGGADPVNSIAWRKDKFEFVKGTHVTVPYFEGHKKQMPVVLLKDKKTGQKTWVMNVHNPASTKNHPGNEHNRDVATKNEIDFIKHLEKTTGFPVILTGDMNEKAEARQHITKGTDMTAAMNGKHSHSRQVGIDWIFGSPNFQFDFYDRDSSNKVRSASVHPVVYINVHIPAGKKA
jgi:hypothetical protein